MQAPLILPVVFYQTAKGSVPVLEWLRGMVVADRKKIGLDLLRVQENWPIGMPLCKNLGDKLWEIRSALTDGKTARLLFCFNDSEIYVLHGFVKKSQKTLEQDLLLARKRLKEVLNG